MEKKTEQKKTIAQALKDYIAKEQQKTYEIIRDFPISERKLKETWEATRKITESLEFEIIKEKKE